MMKQSTFIILGVKTLILFLAISSPIQAEEIHAFIRSIVSDKYGGESAEDLLIVYGGSCNPSNAKDIFAESNIDGGLVGGASLSANSFVEIIKSF